jgi:hypothetical protein
VFAVTPEASIHARMEISKQSYALLKTHPRAHAIIAYHSDDTDEWRLSLITTQVTRDKEGVKETVSNPRRYSYVLGPKAKVNTPTKYLISKGKIADLSDLKERFSLEVVNKDFYKEISNLFTKLTGGTHTNGRNSEEYKAMLRLPSIAEGDQRNLEFAVRLIGRVIFCWFLREKRSEAGISLMPKELLSSQAIEKQPDYYHTVLEPIFFELLNKHIKSRKDRYISTPFASIPYLNGGLFSPDYDDYFSYNEGKQAINHNTVIVPDDWIKEFFAFLETYNFTIDENVSFDEELSIDPEMLGRIFENLLAEINPETGESARKSTGSYYTPRVIVDYMVDESLFAYLKERTAIQDPKLRAIISYDLEDNLAYPLTEIEYGKVIDALSAIKILDPACGSGAYPIGALQKIVFILQQVDPDGRKWFEKQVANTAPEIKRVIEREFANKNFNYIRKLGVIRENIFGVDIQPIATEISRLRCFLTLVVDESIHDDLENRGVEPLPNLDFKFVTSNTLIRLSEGKEQSLFKDKERIDQLKELRDQFFSSTNSERHQLKLDFKELQNQMLVRMIEMRGGDELTQKLSTWDPFSHKITPWFEPEWMFGVSNFDVVIGNPPYVDSEGMVNAGQAELRDTIQDTYKWTRGNWDLYIAFFEAGFRFLSEGGILTYISPDKWISKSFGDEFRKNAISNIFAILKSGRGIFESAKVDSIVTFLCKKQTPTISIIDYVDDKFVEKRLIEKSTLSSPFALDHLFSDNLDFLARIEAFPKRVSDFGICESACATSDAYKIKPLIKDLKQEKLDDIYLPIINTGTIGKYYSKWGLKEMTYLKDKYARPVVARDDFLAEFPNSYGRKSILPKLIIKGLNKLDACPDLKGNIVPGKTTLIITSENIEDLKFLLGIMNSKLAIFYIKEKYPASSYNQGTTFTKDMLANFPIPEITEDDKRAMISLVEKIMVITGSGKFTESEKEMEAIEIIQGEIDNYIQNLYKLSEDEKRLVSS